VVVSFDPADTPALASSTKATWLERYGRPGTEVGWHFLTGSETAIAELTRSVGFRYVRLENSTDFAHAAGIMVLTPDARIARYFFGVEYAPRDIRLGLIEAADHEIGSLVDQVLLYCFHYDPATGKYSAVAMNLIRLGGGVTVAVLAVFLLAQWRRERRRQPASASA
jgi:protein SCO1/2